MKKQIFIPRYFLVFGVIFTGLLFPTTGHGQFAELHIALKTLAPFELRIDSTYYSAKHSLSIKQIRPGFRHVKITQRRGNGVNQTRTVTLYEGRINLPKNTITSVTLRDNGRLKVKQTKIIRPGLQQGSRSIYA